VDNVVSLPTRDGSPRTIDDQISHAAALARVLLRVVDKLEDDLPPGLDRETERTIVDVRLLMEDLVSRLEVVKEMSHD
jgi:hypothetical protein